MFSDPLFWFSITLLLLGIFYGIRWYLERRRLIRWLRHMANRTDAEITADAQYREIVEAAMDAYQDKLKQAGLKE